MLKLIFKPLQVCLVNASHVKDILTRPLDFRPPMMYYTSIPAAQERPPQNRRWDAAKLRDLRKRLDANVVSPQEVEDVAHDMMDGEIVDLASDWLGNTVRDIKLPKTSVMILTP